MLEVRRLVVLVDDLVLGVFGGLRHVLVGVGHKVVYDFHQLNLKVNIVFKVRSDDHASGCKLNPDVGYLILGALYPAFDIELLEEFSGHHCDYFLAENYEGSAVRPLRRLKHFFLDYLHQFLTALDMVLMGDDLGQTAAGGLLCILVSCKGELK